MVGILSWDQYYKKITTNTTTVGSSVEGDEQPDQPYSQTCMECCNSFCGFVINTTAYHLTPIQPSSRSSTKELPKTISPVLVMQPSIANKPTQLVLNNGANQVLIPLNNVLHAVKIMKWHKIANF